MPCLLGRPTLHSQLVPKQVWCTKSISPSLGQELCEIRSNFTILHKRQSRNDKQQSSIGHHDSISKALEDHRALHHVLNAVTPRPALL